MDCSKRIQNGSVKTQMEITTFVIVLQHFGTLFYKILFSCLFSGVVLYSILSCHLLTSNLLSPPFHLPFRSLLSPNFGLLFIAFFSELSITESQGAEEYPT
jgi:hypothetical protein